MNKKNINLNKDLINLIIGRKGGRTTIRIIDKLLIQPYNINQLSKELNLNYNTIKYHVELIVKSEFLVGGEAKYGCLYFPTEKLKNNLKEYEQIKNYINKKSGNDNEK